MSAVNLYLDVQSGQLVESPTSTSNASLPLVYQGDNRTWNIFPLDPTGSLTTPYSTATDWSTSTIKVAICGGAGSPTGTLGGPAPIAFTDLTGWTWSSDHFTGLLNCNTQEYANFLGTAAVKSSTFEIEETDEVGPTRFQFPCTCKAQVIESDIMSLAGLPAYFVGETAPTGSIGVGAMWLKISTATLSMWDGAAWDALHP